VQIGPSEIGQDPRASHRQRRNQTSLSRTIAPALTMDTPSATIPDPSDLALSAIELEIAKRADALVALLGSNGRLAFECWRHAEGEIWDRIFLTEKMSAAAAKPPASAGPAPELRFPRGGEIAKPI
jgi:hypothetical protein